MYVNGGLNFDVKISSHLQLVFTITHHCFGVRCVVALSGCIITFDVLFTAVQANRIQLARHRRSGVIYEQLAVAVCYWSTLLPRTAYIYRVLAFTQAFSIRRLSEAKC